MSITWKRIRCSLFLACLTLLGVGIHRLEPDEPRWTVAGDDRPACFSADGQRVYTLPYKVSGALSGPDLWTPIDVVWDDEDNAMWPTAWNLRGWNLQAGEICSTHPAGARLLMLRRTCSENGRYFASIEAPDKDAKDKRRFICLVELNTGEERRLPVHPDLGKPSLCFSPCGQYLVAGLTSGFAPIQVFDCANGKLLAEWERSYLLYEKNARFWEGHLLYGENDAAGRHHMVLWNLRDRKIAAKVGDFAESPDVNVHGHFAVVSGDEPGKWRTWNLRTLKLQAEWKTTLKEGASIDLVGIGERCYACVSGTGDAGDMLETWDIETGMRVATCERLERSSIRSGRFLAIYPSPLIPGPLPPFEMLELPSLQQLWKADGDGWGMPVYTKDGKHLSTWHVNEIRFLERETGKVRHTVTVGRFGTSNSFFRFFGPAVDPSKDGKRITLCSLDEVADPWAFAKDVPVLREFLEWLGVDLNREAEVQFVIVVFDLETGRERLRLTTRNVQSVSLSDDGTSLLTTHGDVLRCWDVGSTKPLLWPIAIPAALGVLLWGRAHGVAHWRKRRAAAKLQPPPATTA